MVKSIQWILYWSSGRFKGFCEGPPSAACMGARPITGVIARLDRATQYAVTAVMESRGRGVLGRPVKPGDDTEWMLRTRRGGRASGAAHTFFLTSLILENALPPPPSFLLPPQ